MQKIKPLVFLFICWLFLLPVGAQIRFVRTNALGGDTRIGLFLAEGDEVVSTASGVPQVRMRLDILPDMVTVSKGNIKIEVYRSTDEAPELVASFNYPVKQGQDHIDLRMNLPEFKNQSENFDFIVYDTEGNPRSKFRNSFASKELITFKPKPPSLELSDDKLLDEQELEYIAKKFAISMVPAGQPVGMQKQDGVYNLQVPFRKSSGKLTQRNKIVNKILDFDEVGTLEERDNHDAAPKGTVFLDKDTGLIYIKSSDASGDWSSPIEFASKQGSNGDDATSGGGATTIINASPITTVVQQLDPSQIQNGSIAVDKIQSVVRTQTLNVPLKEALRSSSVLLGTVAASTMPVLRYQNAGNSTWSTVLPEDLLRDDPNNPNIKIKLAWSPSNNSAQVVDWRLAYISYADGDIINPSAMQNLDAPSSAPALFLTLTETEFTIPIASLDRYLTFTLSRLDNRDIKANLSSISIEYPGRILK